jgi:hypothetical protein
MIRWWNAYAMVTQDGQIEDGPLQTYAMSLPHGYASGSEVP